MRKVVVLVMHGVPPADFPREEAREYFRLHSESGDEQERRRYEELDGKMRRWPRNADNDPYYVGSHRLADELTRAAGLEVAVAFNEFCGPSVDEALDQAAAGGAGGAIVVTPMMTSGGEHSEADIPQAIERAGTRHPHVRYVYAWPFATQAVAGFLAAHIGPFLED